MTDDGVDKNHLRAALLTLPKAELHLHLEGAPRWSTLRRAHQRYYGVALPEVPPWYAPEFRFAHFGEFQSLFRRYIHPWLQTPNGYCELIRDVVDGLLEQGVRYAEINIAASLVEHHGASLDGVWQSFEEELERAKTQGTVIRPFVGLMRNHGVETAIAWVKKMRSLEVVAGFDLQGDEVGWPAEQFLPALDLARDAGKRVKVHVGEMTGPVHIRRAVEQLGVEQIGHGTSAIHDKDVVNLLCDRGVTVEVCPTSNERLGYVSSYSAHPILSLDEAGVIVTVNSDDPTFFGVTLTDELFRLATERQVSLSVIKRWMENAFRRAILDEITRQKYLSELDDWLIAQTLPSSNMFS